MSTHRYAPGFPRVGSPRDGRVLLLATPRATARAAHPVAMTPKEIAQ